MHSYTCTNERTKNARKNIQSVYTIHCEKKNIIVNHNNVTGNRNQI